jgi:hypothetical protein
VGKVRFDFELREDFLKNDTQQWVIEREGDNVIEHGPFDSLKEAMELIARHKKELRR